MSKPFTYWVRLALVVTMCTLVTFSPVNAGRLMDRLLHRDACKTSATECCEPISPCEPSYLVVPCAPCPSEPAPQCAATMSSVPVVTGCDSIPASSCGCEAGMNVPPTVTHTVPLGPAVDAKPSSSVPHVGQPAPGVDAPKIAPSKAITPDAVVEKPASLKTV